MIQRLGESSEASARRLSRVALAVDESTLRVV
jgi:hypothetical protein